MDINKLSRYKSAVQIKTVQDDPDEVTILDDDVVIPYSDSYLTHVVTPQQRGRLDLIAYIHYGNPLLWWVIAKANYVDNPLSLESGTVLKIPDKETIYSKGGALSQW